MQAFICVLLYFFGRDIPDPLVRVCCAVSRAHPRCLFWCCGCVSFAFGGRAYCRGLCWDAGRADCRVPGRASIPPQLGVGRRGAELARLHWRRVTLPSLTCPRLGAPVPTRCRRHIRAPRHTAVSDRPEARGACADTLSASSQSA